MGFWARLWRGMTQKGSPEDWFREFGGSGRTASNVVVNQSTAMKVTAAMACVRVRSQDFAKLPPMIERVAKDGTRTPARDHFLYAIFRKPNAWQTWFEFAEQMQMAFLLRGNAYAVVLRDGRGKPIALIPVNPDRVSLYEAPGGELFYQVARIGQHETAVLRDFPLMIPADDVFHIRGPSFNGLVGLSAITYGAEALGLSIVQERHSANLYGNGARPSGILKTDKKLGAEAAKSLKEQWNRVFRGSGGEDSGGTAVLEEGLTWQALTLTSVDMEFLASRKLQIEEVCRIFGVSPVKIGVLEAAAGRAFEQIQLTHYSDAVHPDLVRWEHKLEAYFGIGDDMDVSFDESELLRSDLKARSDAARVLAVSGITTPNEARRGFRLNPYPGGDVLLVPANVVPIEMAGQAQAGGAIPPGPGSDQTGAPAPGGDGDPAAVINNDFPAPLTLNVNIDATAPASGNVRKTGRLVRNPDGSADFEIDEVPA